jgi:hypothetical protein
VTKWGLIGTWAPNCSQPPKSGNAYVGYETTASGGIVNKRDFGEGVRDALDVSYAAVSADHLLNLRSYVPSVPETGEYGLKKLSATTYRAWYHRNEKQEYSIKDGIITANGKPSMVQHKCR